MKKKLSAEDFMVLREPLVNGRQSPVSLAGALLIGSVMQLLVWYLTYYAAGESTLYPNAAALRDVHFLLTIVIILFSILFSIPAVYRKGGKIQYIVTILSTQNFGALFFLIGLFLLGEQEGLLENTLMSITVTGVFFGVLLLAAAFLRSVLLLFLGHYKSGSHSEKRRKKTEKLLNLPAIIAGSAALVFIMQQAIKGFGLAELETISLIVLFMALSYTLIYILPEQLIILYCKYRFKSFNFNERGFLHSETSD